MARSGVRPADLRSAEPFETVQREAADILTGRIIVGHSIANDLQVCVRRAEPATMTGHVVPDHYASGASGSRYNPCCIGCFTIRMFVCMSVDGYT